MTNNTSTQRNSYSNIVSQQPTFKHPSKDQAVVLTSLEGFKLHEYITAVGSIIGPKNVIFASRITNNRICIYLSSSNLVDNFLTNRNTIQIQNTDIEIRRLVTPAQRLVISNVCPTIPNAEIEKLLLSFNTKLMSRITFLRVGMQESDYSHILSFRRQVYISPNENISLPDSVLLTYDNTSYRIFLSIDGLNCALCKTVGHLQTDCPKNTYQNIDGAQGINDPTQNPSPSDQTQNLPKTQTQMKAQETAMKISNITQSETEIPSVNIEHSIPPQAKRQLSNSSDSVTPDNQTKFVTPKDAPPKKYKPTMPTESATLALEPSREFIEGKKEITGMGFWEFCDFIKNASGSRDPMSIAKNYTENLNELITLLTDVHLIVKDRSQKIKITRIKKRLRAQSSETDLSDSFSDASQDTY